MLSAIFTPTDTTDYNSRLRITPAAAAGSEVHARAAAPDSTSARRSAGCWSLARYRVLAIGGCGSAAPPPASQSYALVVFATDTVTPAKTTTGVALTAQ